MDEDNDTVYLAVYNPCGQRTVELVTNTPDGRRTTLEAAERVASWLKAAGLDVWKIYVKRTLPVMIIEVPKDVPLEGALGGHRWSNLLREFSVSDMNQISYILPSTLRSYKDIVLRQQFVEMDIGDSRDIHIPRGVFMNPYPAPDRSLLPENLFGLARPLPPPEESQAKLVPDSVSLEQDVVQTTEPHANCNQEHSNSSAPHVDAQHNDAVELPDVERPAAKRPKVDHTAKIKNQKPLHTNKEGQPSLHGIVVPRPKNTALPKPGPQIAPAVPANLITTEVNVPDNLASAVQAAADQFRANYRPVPPPPTIKTEAEVDIKPIIKAELIGGCNETRHIISAAVAVKKEEQEDVKPVLPKPEPPAVEQYTQRDIPRSILAAQPPERRVKQSTHSRSPMTGQKRPR